LRRIGCHSARDKLAIRAEGDRVNRRYETRHGRHGPHGVGPTPRAGTTAPVGVQPATSGPFNHATVAATACVTCHSAASGSGKPTSHLATSNTCQSCHTTLAWLPVRAVDHTQVTGTCVSCHNGVIAMGKPLAPPGHERRLRELSYHQRLDAGALYHARSPRIPAPTCHNAVQAIGIAAPHPHSDHPAVRCLPRDARLEAGADRSLDLYQRLRHLPQQQQRGRLSPGHMSTRRDCATCHSYPGLEPHPLPAHQRRLPGHSPRRVELRELSHVQYDQVPYPSAANAGTCAGCHAKDFKPAAHPKMIKGPKLHRQ